MTFTGDEFKNLLYIFPLFSAILCAFYVRHLNRRKKEVEESEGNWRKLSIMPSGSPVEQALGSARKQAAGNGRHGYSTSEDGEVEPFRLGRASSIVSGEQHPDDALGMLTDKHIGLVIEYNDSAIEVHVKKAKLSMTPTALKKSVADILVKCGLLPANPGIDRVDGSSAGPPRSRIMFTAPMERMKKAVWTVREELAWTRHIEGVDDVGVAYTVQQVTRGLKTRIKFEPCTILFNET